MYHWEKLSPNEFKEIQDYVSENDKNLSDAVKEFVGSVEDPKKEIFLDYAGFTQFMTIYLETCIPDDLCRHFFCSLLKKKPHTSSIRHHGYLSRSDSDSMVAFEKNTSRKARHSPSSSISEPTEIRLMTNFLDKEIDSSGKISEEEVVGKISLKDLVCYLNLLEAGNPENKLEFMFRLYDTDGNGVLDAEEIESIINQMMTVAKYSGWDVSELKPILRKMMQEIDYNSDGQVNLEEWMKAGSSNIPLMVLLGVDSMPIDDENHCWELKHFNSPRFCNLCSRMLVGLGKQGLQCIYCKYTVHERCIQDVGHSCIMTCDNPRPMTHFWVRENEIGRCDKCKGFIKSYHRLAGMRCRWCLSVVHIKCVGNTSEECTMGSFGQLVLSPCDVSMVTPSSASYDVRSGLEITLRSVTGLASSFPRPDRRAESMQIEQISEERPIPRGPGSTPLLVFINPKSGGRQGKDLMKKFLYLLNPRQVFDVIADQGFMRGLKFFKDFPNHKILCCGGDGTVGWLLESMDKMNYEDERPPVAILPLGTGNDLARSLKWGGGYQGENPTKIFKMITSSCNVVMLDRWRIDIRPLEIAGGDPDEPCKIPCNIINNYFSIGVDASIAHMFHVMREKNPKKFKSRMLNKLVYLECGTIETIRATCKNLHEYVQVSCDGVAMNLFKGRSMEGVTVLNIPSIYGGSSLWGEPSKAKKKKKKSEDEEESSGPVIQPHVHTAVQDISDRRIEVVGLINTFHMAKIKSGLQSGERLGHCSVISIQTFREFPMQIDGEPWMQPPCVITITHENQVPMLAACPQSRFANFFQNMRKKRRN